MSITTTTTFFQAVTADTDVLPRWDFSKFYPDVDSPEFEADFMVLEAWSVDFVKRFEGKISGLSGDQLAAAIDESKKMDDLAGKIMTFVSLKATQDSKKYAPADEACDNRIAPLSAQEAFFGHEIKQISETDMTAMLASSPALQVFAPWLERLRKGIPHTPPLEVTKYATETSASSGWVALYGKLGADKRYPFEGRELNQTEILNIFTNDPSAERRKAAHEAFMEGFRNKRDALIAAHIFNERIRLKNVGDKWANFSNPWDSKHMANGVTSDMVDALERAAKESYPVMQRFYKLKAKLMGLDALEISDRNFNPLEALGGKAEKTYIPFAEAKKMVLDSYRRFSPAIADIAQKFFDEGWIDAPVDKNKRGGAYSSAGAARLVGPRVMLNYKGTPRDVATMSHELGHGVHQYLAAHKGDRIVYSPLTFAEMASVFGEMLTFKSLLRAAKNDDDRRKLLADKINDMISTVFRQISFHDFEKRIHGAAKKNNRPLGEDELAAHFQAAIQESYGDSVKLPADYGVTYRYVSHFMNSPFYVYAYAFGDALVNALYQVYEEGSVPDFEEKYIKMLEMGGTLKPSDLKEMFGLDITDPGFWKKGIKTIETMLHELEVLCEPLLKPAAHQVVAVATPAP